MAIDLHKADFLGRGWKFPPEFDRASHSVVTTEKEADINASLHVLLTTTLGERIMQPKYGCNMDTLLFESMDTTTQTIIIDKIKTSILYFESRIEVLSVELDTDRLPEGLLVVRIDYRIKATNSRFNFVFPYYINEGTEINLFTTDKPI